MGAQRRNVSHLQAWVVAGIEDPSGSTTARLKTMRFIGIDIGAASHTVARLNDEGKLEGRPTSYPESADGYVALLAYLGRPEQVARVVMEATGHYGLNLLHYLNARGYTVCVVDPREAKRFAEMGIRRAKTDAADATSLADFGYTKRLPTTELPDEETRGIRDLARFRAGLVQRLGDDTRRLHAEVDQVFPEFTSVVKDLSSQLATALLIRWPCARDMREADVSVVAELRYDGHRHVGVERATALKAAATTSIAHKATMAGKTIVRMLCEALRQTAEQIAELDDMQTAAVTKSELGKLLMTVPGVAHTTAARIIGEVDNPATFKSGDAFAAYVGAVPTVVRSGTSVCKRGSLSPFANRGLRQSLWMPLLACVKRKLPWIAQIYDRFRGAGKPHRVAMIAAMRHWLLAIYAVCKRKTAFTAEAPARSPRPSAT